MLSVITIIIVVVVVTIIIIDIIIFVVVVVVVYLKYSPTGSRMCVASGANNFQPATGKLNITQCEELT